MNELTQELVQSLFTYRDGFLYWKIQKGNRIKIGNKAGSLHHNGYYMIKINTKSYQSHRLIYLYHYGYLPNQIDHIDRDKGNNKIENLREITNTQNQWNAKPNKNKSSKFKGIHWDKQNKKWRSRIQINGKRIHLGFFNDEWTAAFIYNVYARDVFGEFAYLNKLE